MVLFRVDGNEKIGLGHIMRCLSIAFALRNKSIKVVFALADTKCEGLVKQKGFDSIVLNSNYNNLEHELTLFLEVIKNNKIKTVVIDSYFVTQRYLCSISKVAKSVYIDDVLAFPYQVDMLINYNIFSSISAYDYLYKNESKKPIFLLGTKYVPLRKEFLDCNYRVPKKKANNILVLTGGGDPEHVGIRFLNYIFNNQVLYSDLFFYFVVGFANNDYNKMQEISTKIPNVFLLKNVDHMRDLMCSSDLAISASGSTLYELAVTGVPTISYVIAPNQYEIATSFEKNGITKNVGYISDEYEFESVVFTALYEIINDYNLRKKMAFLGQDKINKNGSEVLADRIISELLFD